MAEHLLFIYGTARKSNALEFLMSDQTVGHAKLVGFGWTVEKYPLVLASRFKAPFLLFRPGIGKNVFGDVYRVDDKRLQYMDKAEQVPLLYDRDWIRIHLTKDANGEDIADQNIKHDCHTYFLKNFKPELLNEEYVSDYDSRVSRDDLNPFDLPDDCYEIIRREVTHTESAANEDLTSWVQILPDKYKPK